MHRWLFCSLPGLAGLLLFWLLYNSLYTVQRAVHQTAPSPAIRWIATIAESGQTESLSLLIVRLKLKRECGISIIALAYIKGHKLVT